MSKQTQQNASAVQAHLMSHFTMLFNFLYDPNLKYHASLSPEAKVLYGLLFSRWCLSNKPENYENFTDAEGNLFILFDRSEMAEKLGIGQNKPTALMKELQKVGLVRDERMGYKQKNRIFVMLPTAEEVFGEVGLNSRTTESVGHTETGDEPRNPCTMTHGNCATEIDRLKLDRTLNTLSKERGACSSPIIDQAKKELFRPTKGLFEKSIKIKDLEAIRKTLNGNKQKRETAEVKICIAKLTGNWEKVTGRDLGYWYTFEVYPEIMEKKMVGDPGKDSTIFSDLVKSMEDPELIFYSLKYICKLYPKFTAKEAYKDPSLFNLSNSRNWKPTKEMLERAFDLAEQFIDNGYAEKASRMQADSDSQEETSDEVVIF